MTKRIEENFAKTSIISSLLKREALSSWKYCRRGEQWQDDIIDRIAKRKISWELPPKLSFCALKFSLRWWKINISEDFPQKVLSADSDTFLSDPSPIIIALSLSQSLPLLNFAQILDFQSNPKRCALPKCTLKNCSHILRTISNPSWAPNVPIWLYPGPTIPPARPCLLRGFGLLMMMMIIALSHWADEAPLSFGQVARELGSQVTQRLKIQTFLCHKFLLVFPCASFPGVISNLDTSTKFTKLQND